ncbi:MAG: phosphatase PAP2 family protein [[Actinobacillus] rossii]|nr:phosphatase PAP2 family protein [[Actinobacillus] rossii]MDY3123086.1 phosphatase PAP2 family protein [[Actinobacillus] rossii]
MLKRLSLYTFLLCLVPIFVWIFSWKWAGDAHLTDFDYFLYELTETGSTPYSFISCGILIILFRPIFPNRKKWLLATVIMLFSIGFTQGISTMTKSIFAQPRPYVVELAAKSNITANDFYDKPRAERQIVVRQFYASIPETPDYLSSHREKETGYSFPSGHTMFAATWLMLVVGFTEFYGRRKRLSKILRTAILIWAIFMLISRLRLGMHNPIDLLASILIAWVIHCIIFTFLYKKAIFIKE